MPREDEHFGEDTYSLYLRDLSWLPNHLSLDEELALGARIVEGDKHARDKLIEANLHFAIFMALRYKRPGVELADLVQAANLGLIKAVVKWKPNARIKFITYARYHIRDQILRWVANARFIRLPGKLQLLLPRIRRTYSDLWSREGREPTVEELAKEAKVSLYYAGEFLTLSNNEPVSLETVIGTNGEGGEITLGDVLQAPPLVGIPSNAAERAKELLATLPAAERDVLVMFYGLEGARVSDAKIAEHLGLKRRRVEHIRARALRWLAKPLDQLPKRTGRPIRPALEQLPHEQRQDLPR